MLAHELLLKYPRCAEAQQVSGGSAGQDESRSVGTWHSSRLRIKKRKDLWLLLCLRYWLFSGRQVSMCSEILCIVQHVA